MFAKKRRMFSKWRWVRPQISTQTWLIARSTNRLTVGMLLSAMSGQISLVSVTQLLKILYRRDLAWWWELGFWLFNHKIFLIPPLSSVKFLWPSPPPHWQLIFLGIIVAMRAWVVCHVSCVIFTTEFESTWEIFIKTNYSPQTPWILLNNSLDFKIHRA